MAIAVGVRVCALGILPVFDPSVDQPNLQSHTAGPRAATTRQESLVFWNFRNRILPAE